MAAIFISHSSLDNALAGQLKDWLAAEGYERVFLDFDKHTGLAAGEGWEARLYTELARCHAVVLVVTPNWLDSKWCFAEYTQARALGKTIFPVILSAVGALSVAADIQSIDLRDWDSEGRAHLGRRLRLLTGEVARGFTWDHARPPFPGMHAFDRGDAAVFFGRDPEVREVIERLEARRSHGGGPMLLVLGGSGSGKSSLMRAGVLETLARRTNHWIVLPTIRPQAAPVEALAKAMAEATARPAEWRRWYGRLMGDDTAGALRDFARDLRVGPAAHASVLLAVDQFEELYTVEAGVGERPAFLRALSALAAGGGALPWQAIATARSDLLDQMMAHDGGARLVVETYALRPMPMDRVPSLIEGPATVGAVALERGFVERVQRDATTPEALPLLAVALRELYDRHGAQRRFTIAQYEALGDPERGLGPLANAIRQKADRALAAAQATEAELTALRGALIPAVVRVDDSGAFLRQPARRSLMPQAAGRLVDVLTAARLLVAGGEDDADRIEVAHEALFTAWPLLRGWLEEERAFLQALVRLDRAASLWEERARSADYLLPSGAQLVEAEDIALKRPQALAGRAVGAALIAASSAAERQRQTARQREGRARLRRRFIYATIAVVALFMVLVGGSFVAWQAYERQHAQRMARASHLVAVIENLQRTMPHDRAHQIRRLIAVLPAEPIEAAAILDLTAHAQARLTEAILINREIARFEDLDGGEKDEKGELPAMVESAATSADGRRAIGATATTVRLWDTQATPPSMVVLGEAGTERTVHMSADGRLAVTVAVTGQTIELWDLATAPPRRRTARAPATPSSTAMSTDGRWLAIGGAGGVHLFDTVQERWRDLTAIPKDASVTTLIVRGGDHVLIAGIADGRGFVFDAKADTHFELGESGIVDITLAATREVAATVSDGGEVELWQLESGAPVGQKLDLASRDLRRAAKIRQVVLDPEGHTIATLDDSSQLMLWDVPRETDESAAIGPQPLILRDSVRVITRLDDGRRVLALGFDNKASLFDLTGTTFHRQTLPPPEWAMFGAGGEAIVVGESSGDIVVRTLGPTPTKSRVTQDSVDDPIAASRDGRVVVVSSDGDKHHTVWLRATPEWASFTLPDGLDKDAVALSDNGAVLVVKSADNALEVMDVGNTEAKRRITVKVPGELVAFAVSGDGTVLATSHVDATVRIWTLTDNPPRPVDLPRRTKRAVTLSLDRTGGLLAICDPIGEVEIWQTKGTPEIQQKLLAGSASPAILKFNPEGDGLLVRDSARTGSLVEVFDLTPTEPTRIDVTWLARNALSLSFTQDGRHLVAIDRRGNIHRWPVLLDARELLALARRSVAK